MYSIKKTSSTPVPPGGPDLPPSQEISQIEYLQELSRKLDMNLRLNEKHVFSIFGIPFDEIFSLLKDLYKGHANKMLQDILDHADIDLSVDKKIQNDPESARELVIKITLASEVIDKYADLLELAIGKQSNKEQQEIISNADDKRNRFRSKLDRIQMIKAMLSLREQIQEMQDAHRASHCFSFMCSGKTINRLNSINQFLDELVSPGYSTKEIQGGLIFLYSQLGLIFKSSQESVEVDRRFRETFDENLVSLLTAPGNESLIESFLARAIGLEIKWPEHFSAQLEGDRCDRAINV